MQDGKLRLGALKAFLDVLSLIEVLPSGNSCTLSLSIVIVGRKNTLKMHCTLLWPPSTVWISF